jgi:hypothetical protein
LDLSCHKFHNLTHYRAEHFNNFFAVHPVSNSSSDNFATEVLTC